MTTTQILLFLLAIFPGLAISYTIYRMDKYEKEPWYQLLICFVLGMLLMPLAWYPERFLEESAYTMTTDMPRFVFTALVAFVAVALTEELLKFLALRLYIFPKAAFNEPMDGIVYAVLIAMGFATAENLQYVLVLQGGFESGLVRMFTAVPAHGMLAVIMGYFVGQAKFDNYNRLRLFMRGLGLAILGHGAYDFFILQQYYPGLAILALVLLVLGYWLSSQLIRRHQDNSPFKDEV